MNDTQDSVTRELSIDAPIAHVWRLISEAEHVRSWYAFDGASIDLRVGGFIEHYWHEHGRFRGVIESVAPPSLLTYWYSNVPDVDPAPGHQTLVSFRLASMSANRTLINVTESGINSLRLSETERAAYLAATTQGWDGGLAALTDLLRERHD